MHAKADAETIAVLPALQHPNVTLLVDHEVTRLQTDAGGRTVTGVITQHGSAEEVFTADIVVRLGRGDQQRPVAAVLGE